MAALREDTQAWWADMLARDLDELDEDEKPATADAEGLRRFLEAEVLPWFENRKAELANRPLIREQAFGESLDLVCPAGNTESEVPFFTPYEGPMFGEAFRDLRRQLDGSWKLIPDEIGRAHV